MIIADLGEILEIPIIETLSFTNNFRLDTSHNFAIKKSTAGNSEFSFETLLPRRVETFSEKLEGKLQGQRRLGFKRFNTSSREVSVFFSKSFNNFFNGISTEASTNSEKRETGNSTTGL